MVAKVTKVDIAQVQARLEELRATGGNAQAALAAFGGVILNRIRLGFRLGRSPWGTSWQGLLLRRGQPLRNTGMLRNSITMAQGPGRVTIGTNHPGRNVHQFGATIKPKHASRLVFPGPGGLIFAKQVTIPARPFMPINPAGNVDVPGPWVASGLQAMQRALDL